MAKVSKGPHHLTVIAYIDDARRISKLERILSTHGSIESEYGMRASDGKGRRPIVNIIYLVTTDSPGTLKNALANNELVGIKLHVL